MFSANPIGPAAPTGGPLPPAVAEAKARRRKERKERNLKGIQDDKVRKERLENRKRLKEQVQEDAEEKRAELQRMDDLTQLKVWLGRGALRFSQVQNVQPGWIIAYETNEGRAMSALQYRMYQQAAQTGLPVPNPPVWWQVGILKYPLAQQTLSSVGFDQFVNFFGAEEPLWAMEIPVAMELGLFVAAWVDSNPVLDSDWDRGGAGPFLMDVSASMIEEGRLDPAAAALNEERQQEAREYTARRLQQPGAPEADRPLPPALEVEVPPSGGAGDEAEPMEDAQDAQDAEAEQPPQPPEIYPLYAYVGGRPDDGLLAILRSLVKTFAAFAIQTEEGDTQEQKIEAFMNRLKTTADVAGPNLTVEVIQAERNMYNLYKEIDPANRPAEFDHFIDHAIELVVKAGPPEGGWPNVAAPGYDPPPAPGMTVAQVQQATAEKQATAPPPAPREYHSIVDYMKTPTGRDAFDSLTKSANKDFRSMVKQFLPPISTREKVFIVRIGREFTPGTRSAAFFSDNQNPIDEPEINLGPAYGNPPSFTMEDVFTQTVKANGKQEYSVAADEPESFGLFGHKQMEHLYEHLVRKARPLFSVSADRAVEFFPNSYVCSNVWWWESKLKKLPLGMQWKEIGRGGFNVAYKLQRDGLPPGDAALAFCPPAVAYNVNTLRETLPSMMTHGLIKRIAMLDPNSESNITFCMRELYIAGYAASCGVGPKILAAYIQPGGYKKGYVPDVEMNPGDSEERFANPLYEPKQNLRYNASWNEADAPPEGWMKFKGSWSDTVEKYNGGHNVLRYLNASYNLKVKNPNVNEQDPRSYRWERMVVLMEAYEGDMTSKSFKWPKGVLQRRLIIQALMKTFSKMGEAGILHCDIKAPNVVYRTWTTGKAKKWNNIETMAIDFDPEFVKIVPWLPGPVIALINAACFFAADACFEKERFKEYTMEPLKKLHKEVMDNYPDGVAQAFRALLPDERDNIPFEENDVRPVWLSTLFNDEYEAARVFYRWVRMYMVNRCFRWRYLYGQAPPNASMLARLLAMAQHSDPRRALDPPDILKRGNFPFELHADPQVRMQMAMEASASVWGGLRFDPPETGSGWDSGWDSGVETEWDSDGEAPEDL